MSDEKRQTRLLPFRLRRAGATRRDARRGADGAEDFSADAELTALLRMWEAPPPDAGARERLLADFRASTGRMPLWRRALKAELRVPLPVAACAVGVFLLSLYALGARATARVAPAAAQTETMPAVVRVVEVPVIQERVVTRTVYVEKKERGEVRGVSSSTDGSELASGQSVAGRAGSHKTPEPARVSDDHAGYFTRVDMNDFEPADKVKIRIVKRESEDEK